MASQHSIYEDHADWYAEVVRRRGLIHLQIIPQIMAFIGNVAGQMILDVACGEGVFSRELSTRGANVTGVDLSQRLLSIAEDTSHINQPTYVYDDARQLSRCDDATFDGAICIMAMMDIDDIGATFESVHRTTKPDAWFVVVITHPCFESPHAHRETIDNETTCLSTRYLTEGVWYGTETGIRSRCGARHRTISTYLNTAIDAGWNLERMLEPRLESPAPPADADDDHPGLLVMKIRRQGDA